MKWVRRGLALAAAIGALFYMYYTVIYMLLGLMPEAGWLLIGLLGCFALIALEIYAELGSTKGGDK